MNPFLVITFVIGYFLGLALDWHSARLPPRQPGVRMRTILAAILLSAISASAAEPPTPPASAASTPSFPPKQLGHFTLSGPVCAKGILGVHIVASDAAEGNIYFNLKAICHGDEPAEDPPEPQSESAKPLPKGVERL